MIFKGLFLIAAVGVVAYYLLGRKKITGTVTALYSDAKISSPNMPSPGDSPQNALIGPSTYTY